jgi:activator of HSP90 ATPase
MYAEGAPKIGTIVMPLLLRFNIFLCKLEAVMNTKTIRQSVTFKASPHQVYEALMDSKKHSAFTGAQANISRKVGGKFSIYGGEIEGENLVLEPDQKIVQLWRYSNWPQGHYSKAKFLLKEVPVGTRLTFTQTGVPEEFYDDISQGWHDYYWEPMKEMLKK